MVVRFLGGEDVCVCLHLYFELKASVTSIENLETSCSGSQSSDAI